MNQSFYTAFQGAGAHQARLDVTAHNISNVNTYGFRASKAEFSALLYQNINAPAGEAAPLYTGSGLKVQKTDTSFASGTFLQTGGKYDYAISGEGFFALQDPATQQVAYTRDGSFQAVLRGDGSYILSSSDGRRVLDKNGGQITWRAGEEPAQEVGVFAFQNKHAMVRKQGNLLLPEAGDHAAAVEAPDLTRGALESSNVELTRELADLIETQRVYSMNLRMLQTCDEIEQTIQSMR